jgi:hypothetical protein
MDVFENVSDTVILQPVLSEMNKLWRYLINIITSYEGLNVSVQKLKAHAKILLQYNTNYNI